MPPLTPAPNKFRAKRGPVKLAPAVNKMPGPRATAPSGPMKQMPISPRRAGLKLAPRKAPTAGKRPNYSKGF